MSLLDAITKKKNEPGAKRCCVVCGHEATGGCGLCFRAGLEAAQEEAARKGLPPEQLEPPAIVTLCSPQENIECSSKHAREKHQPGLIGENDPRWPGPR
jgi:hypothetical protein